MSDAEEFMKVYTQMVKSMEPAFVSASKAFEQFGVSASKAFEQFGVSVSLAFLQIRPPLMFNCGCSSIPDNQLKVSGTREVVTIVENEFAKEKQNPLVIGRYGRCLSR